MNSQKGENENSTKSLWWAVANKTKRMIIIREIVYINFTETLLCVSLVQMTFTAHILDYSIRIRSITCGKTFPDQYNQVIWNVGQANETNDVLWEGGTGLWVHDDKREAFIRCGFSQTHSDTIELNEMKVVQSGCISPLVRPYVCRGSTNKQTHTHTTFRYVFLPSFLRLLLYSQVGDGGINEREKGACDWLWGRTGKLDLMLVLIESTAATSNGVAILHPFVVTNAYLFIYLCNGQCCNRNAYIV